MHEGWKEIVLGDYCERITVGHVGSMANQYRHNGIPFLRSLNINPFCLNLSNLVFIDEIFHKKLKKSELKPGDLVLVRTGYPGTACVIPDYIEVANCSDLVIIRTGKNLDPYFIATVFNSTWGIQSVGGSTVGAAQQHFNIGTAKSLKLFAPPYPVQKTIGGIIRSFNDAIEINNQRIKLLEEAAREFYKEWFVRMRFPGYKKAKFVKGIPDGWNINTCYSFSDVKGGGTPSTTNFEYWDGHISFFTPTDHTDSFFIMATEKKITEKGLYNSSTKLFPKYTTFITARGTVGNICIAGEEMAMNQSCFAVVPHEPNDYYFAFLFTEEMVRYFKQVANGATFDAITLNTFRKYKALIPSKKLRVRFFELVSPFFQQIETLTRQNTELRQIRDRLLPRLISGKLSVRANAKSKQTAGI
ncbi:MAG: restriction endonuclease subunit S [Chitinophagaceae bacterium]|nr:restriction endonuclease subunit S [Chitinophagaceae bacterium]